jgi:hypothetical protein
MLINSNFQNLQGVESHPIAMVPVQTRTGSLLLKSLRPWIRDLGLAASIMAVERRVPRLDVI